MRAVGGTARISVFLQDDLYFAQVTLYFFERLGDFQFNALLKSDFGLWEKIKLGRNIIKSWNYWLGCAKFGRAKSLHHIVWPAQNLKMMVPALTCVFF